MDLKVIISPRAIQDLQGIVRYISFDNADAAERLGYALIDAARGSGIRPESLRAIRLGKIDVRLSNLNSAI